MTKVKISGWRSITLEQFIQLTDVENNVNEEEKPFHVVAIVTDNTPEFIKTAMPYEKVLKAYSDVAGLLSNLPNQAKITKHKDYVLPNWIERLDGSWWSNATFGQVQAVSLEIGRIKEASEKMGRFDLSGFALMCAALFKKEGENLTNEQIILRESFWLQEDMETIWKVFFSLKRWQKRTLRGLKIYFIALKMSLKLQNLAQRLRTIMSVRKES